MFSSNSTTTGSPVTAAPFDALHHCLGEIRRKDVAYRSAKKLLWRNVDHGRIASVVIHVRAVAPKDEHQSGMGARIALLRCSAARSAVFGDVSDR
jgi:hypothetical protein